MHTFSLFQNGKMAELLVEETALAGVKRVAGTLRQDLADVTGAVPVQVEALREVTQENLVLVGTYGRSPLLESVAERGLLSLEGLRGRRSVF